MRPIRLTIKGLRSYREETTIEFADSGLVAIVGDTGAGKSSIMEAVVYALYNATTWEQTDISSLRPDGVRTMSAVLEFEAGGETYRITRSTSDRSYPPAVHLLECISKPGTLRCDKANEIKGHIREIIGLDYEGFLSAIVLPQGRFQTLLLSTRSEKTKILKGILHLGSLERTRDVAIRLGRELERAIAKAEIARAKLLPDPVAEIEAASADLQITEKRQAKLAKIKRAITDTKSAQQSLSAELVRLNSLQTRLQEIALDPAEGEAVVAVAVEIAEARGELEMRSIELASEELTLEQRLQEIDGIALSARLSDLDEIQSLSRQLRDESKLITELRTNVNDERESLEGLKRDLTAAEGEGIGITKELDELRKLEVADLKRQSAIQQLEAQISDRQTSIQKDQAELDQLKETQEQTRVASQQAKKTLERLDTSLAEAEAHRLDHLRHALRKELRAGEDCPVCLQRVTTLPRVSEPTAPAVDLNNLRRQEREQSQLVARLESETMSATKRAHDLAAGIESTNKELADLRESYRQAQGDEESNGDTNLVNQRQKLEAALNASTQKNQQLRRTLGEAQDHLNIEERQLAEMEGGWRQGRARLTDLLHSIFGEDAKVSSDLAQAELEKTKLLINEFEEISKRQSKLREESKAIDSNLNNLDARERQEVTAPISAFRDSLVRLEEILGIELLGESPLDASSLMAIVDRAAENSLDASTKASKDALRIAKDQAELSQAMSTQLAKVNVTTEDELDNLIVACGVVRATAQQRLQLAELQLPQATQIDAAIGPARTRLSAIQDVESLLSNSRFVEFVVTKKEMALLGIASTILRRITGDRFGFAEGFQIAEVASGAARDPRTLSGGELFQASLALALALVELAGRSGGRMGALFLDEGFASLDTTTLDGAMDALELEAASGKLVVVVSHLQAVAERIDQVLRVARDSSGASRVRWLNETDRQQLAMQVITQTDEAAVS